MSDQNILDKSMRSVFVGNIPYEETEEKLKDIFNEVGPVISFKLVYDRETGKPKGYGFCEYKDQETALSAMRNLNGYEIGGRTLRVDNACTEKSRLEMQSLMMGMPTSESHYGNAVNAEKAPEIINNVVSSLPPEQLYELMKQMKACVQNNPVEARNMLLQNPQLGYALLQSLVIMKIVDPETAKRMLYPVHPPPLHCSNGASTSKVQSMPHTSNDWQHNNMYRGQSSSQDLRQAQNQRPFQPPPPPSLSINEPPQSFMATRDHPRSSTIDSDKRSFGDFYNRDHRPNNSSMAMSPPMVSEQQVPLRTVQSSQSQVQQVSNQTVRTSDAEKRMLYPVHPPPLHCSNGASTSKVQSMPRTSNDWQHNNMYRGQSSSQDLRQAQNQRPFQPPPPPSLSNNEPPQSFMATRDHPRSSTIDSDKRSFGDFYNRDHRPNNSSMAMSPPMVSEQQVPLRTVQSSQSQVQQASNQTVGTSDAEKRMLYPVHPPPLHCSNGASTSKVQSMPRTSNDWQHNNMYRGQSSSQDLKQAQNQMPFQPPQSSSLSNNEPPQSFMATRDHPRSSTIDSDKRSFGDFYNRDHRPNNSSMAMSPPMVSEQQVPLQTVQSSQSQVQQASNQTDTISYAEKAALIMEVLQITDAQIAMLSNKERQSILQLKERIFNSRKKN